MGTPFKMKGFGGFGSSPLQQITSETKLKNLPEKIKETGEVIVEKVGNIEVGDIPLFGGISYHQGEKIVEGTKKIGSSISRSFKTGMSTIHEYIQKHRFNPNYKGPLNQ